MPSDYDAGYDAHIPYWKVWVPFPIPAPDSSFLVMQTLRSCDDDSNSWISAIHVGVWIKFPTSALAQPGCCGHLGSICLILCLKNQPTNPQNIFLFVHFPICLYTNEIIGTHQINCFGSLFGFIITPSFTPQPVLRKRFNGNLVNHVIGKIL